MNFEPGHTYKLAIGYWRCDAIRQGLAIGTLFYGDGQVRQRGYVIPTGRAM